MNVVYQTPVEAAVKFPNVANTVYQVAIETARNVIQYLYVTGAIGDHKIDTHVVSYKRFASLCNPGAKISLVLDESFPGTPDPGTPVVIYERGVKVLTGYVVKSTRSRPSYEWLIDIDDTYTRVANYFIEEVTDFEEPQSAKYLIGLILDPTGIEYVIHGVDVTVPPGSSLGLRGAHDALYDVMTYGSWYAWVNADGVLHIKKHIKSAPIVIREPIVAERAISTEQTRNVVKIYGRVLQDGSQVNVSQSVDVPGLLTDLTTVVANPLISSYDDAERIANYISQELGRQTDILNFTVEGNPSIQIGTSGSLYYQDPVTGVVTSGSGPVTSLESKVDKDGYIMDITIGERCPRISGWTADPRELRAVWIAARGSANDPRPEKLVYAGDFGAGGQPTYTILSDIPTGNITAMHVTRNGRRVYLLMRVKTNTMPNAYSSLWYCDNPYGKQPTWTRMVGTGDNIGFPVDADYFSSSPFVSMQMFGNTLWFAVRRHRYGGVYDHVIGNIADQASSVSYTFPSPNGTLFNLVGSKYYYAIQPSQTSGTIQFRQVASGNIAWSIPNILTFDIGLNNGVSRVLGQSTGNWWSNDLDQSTVYYCDESTRSLRLNANVIMTLGNIQLPALTTSIRGDYWGSQYQFVDANGNLYVGFGSGLTKKFQWSTYSGGTVICLDKTNPGKMAWFPRRNDNANEVARYSNDGGSTWTNMTGNWWGTNADVLAKRKMQSVGGFYMIDVHPTFWSSEAPSVDS